MKKNILALFGVLLVIAACSKSGGGGNGGGGGGGGTNCNGVSAAFAANVNPIIQATCATDATCHGASSANGPGPLLTYTQIFNARAAIKASVAAGTMPKVGSLTALQKNTIICWVDAGGPNN